LFCGGAERRELVRQHKGWNGVDYVEVVSEDQKTLHVYFLGRAPEKIAEANVRIEGGERVTDVKVTGVKVNQSGACDRDDYLVVALDKAGDYSTYRLCIVERDEKGHYVRRRDFDSRYWCSDFSFKTDCPSDLDCEPVCGCPPPVRQEPEVNYLAKDYASFRQLILDRLAVVMPDWKERHVPDVGIALVEILAYVGDYLSYFQDAVATEAYLDTARRRISVRRHARLVDYRMHEGCNARAWIWVDASGGNATELRAGDLFFATSEEGSTESGAVLGSDDAAVPGIEVFESLIPRGDEKVTFFERHSRIRFYTWGNRECCLPRGATRAWLRDDWTDPQTPPPSPSDKNPNPTYQQRTPNPPQEPPRGHGLQLKEGDFLIFEEVRSPTTGVSGDADPTHRHVVCLTRVTLVEDPLAPWPGDSGDKPRGTPVLEVEWREEDALPFPLCISAIGRAPECAFIDDVSVAHGNVVLVDHGRSQCGPLGDVPTGETTPCCEGEGAPSETAPVAGDFEPAIDRGPLTFREPVDRRCPAAGKLEQDPHQGLPDMTLTSTAAPGPGQESPAPVTWIPVWSLIGGGSAEAFIVEVDDEGVAHIRFGDGETGERPEAGARFKACYRIGNGPAGNVGAQRIVRVGLYRGTLTGVSLRASNPFPAQGGTSPEPIEEVKLLAPHAFRQRIERAITADDYARLAERDLHREDRTDPKVQAAAATLRWTGSWYEASVSIDALAGTVDVEKLPGQIEKRLDGYRRMGHDLRTGLAVEVPLYVVLCVFVRPHYLAGHVKSALLDALSNRALPDGRLGFFHPDRLTFGQGISVSRLVSAAQAVDGVESVKLMRLERQFEGDQGAVLAGELPLGPMEVACLDNDPSFPENGVLKIQTRGGR
jgi:hypothetical protein